MWLTAGNTRHVTEKMRTRREAVKNSGTEIATSEDTEILLSKRPSGRVANNNPRVTEIGTANRAVTSASFRVFQSQPPTTLTTGLSEARDLPRFNRIKLESQTK